MYVEIGSAPCDEDCLQLGEPNCTPENQKTECFRFIELIRKVCGKEPPGARLMIKGNEHDFGRYYEVCCSYIDDLSEDYAFHIESHAPTKWTGEGGTKWVLHSEVLNDRK